MSIIEKFKKWLKGRKNQEIQGYICPLFISDPANDPNLKNLLKFDTKFIKFRIPFLDPKTHCVDMAFIPKKFQKNLDFLDRLMYVLPITCIFKQRILQGFKIDDYDLIELWTKSVYDEISNQYTQQAMYEEQMQIAADNERVAEELAKVEEKRRLKEEEKQAKIAEREAKKQEEKERKQAEREAKKAEREAEKEKLREQKEKEKEKKLAAQAVAK